MKTLHRRIKQFNKKKSEAPRNNTKKLDDAAEFMKFTLGKSLSDEEKSDKLPSKEADDKKKEAVDEKKEAFDNKKEAVDKKKEVGAKKTVSDNKKVTDNKQPKISLFCKNY